MSNHTPEPWRFEEPEIVGADGYRIAEMIAWKHGPSQCSEGQDNWRRILACVNACAGMEDPAVAIATLKAQRDELLAKEKTACFRECQLVEALKAYINKYGPGYSSTDTLAYDNAAGVLAAIANAEKGKP